jgi:NitT/TauT family transport system substrate-binding protein
MRHAGALTTVIYMIKNLPGDLFQTRLHRRNSLALLAASAASAVFSQTRSIKKTDAVIAKPEKKTLIVATPNRYALLYLPLTVAEQMGYFSQMGLELEISEQPSMARAQQAVMAGLADVVCGWVENTLALQAKGQIFQSFVLMSHVPQVVLGVATRAGKLSSLMQLKGRKIGVVALGSPTHTVAHALLRRAGLTGAEMSFVSVGSAASAVAALRAGQIEALAHMDPLMTQLQQQGEITLLADTRQPHSAAQAIGAMLPSSCLYATPDFLARLPGTAQATCDAIVLALRWLAQASLLDIMKLLPEAAMSDDRQAFIGSLERMRDSFSPDGLMPPLSAQHLLDAMHNADPSLRAQTLDPARCYTNALAQRSARLKA